MCDCKQAINTGYKPKSRQGLLTKHIQELAKTSHGFVGSKRFMLVGRGVGNDRSIADCIFGSTTAINIGAIHSHTTARAIRKLHAFISTP